MNKTLRQHIDEHPEAGSAAVMIFTVDDIMDAYPGKTTHDEALEIIRHLNKGVANEVIHSVIEGLIN